MTDKRSLLVLILFVSVLVLLPFSRFAELPILILGLTGIHALFVHWRQLIYSEQFKILSLVFSCYFLMAIISSIDSYWQLKSIVVAFSSVRFYLATIALLIYLNVSDFRLLIKVVTYFVVFLSFDAIIQYFIGVDIIGRASYEDRLNGIFGEHHAKLGPVLALLLPVVMIGLRKFSSIVRWLSILLIIVTIILSGTRSAWIMMVFTLFAYWLHHVKQRRFQLLAKTAVIATIMLSSLWFYSPEFKQRMNRTLSLFDGTHSGLNFALADRLPIWKTSWHMFEKHPINGVGAHAFRKAYPVYASDDDIWQKKGDVGMHAHHWVLEILAETGVIGLLLTCFAIFKLLRFIRRHTHTHFSWAFMIALISAFLPITSIYSIFASFWSICIWFIGAGFIVTSTRND